MSIYTVDAGSRQTAGAIMVEAWKHGIEVETLYDNQLELTCAYDDKLDRVVNKYKGVTILHRELVKEIFE